LEAVARAVVEIAVCAVIAHRLAATTTTLSTTVPHNATHGIYNRYLQSLDIYCCLHAHRRRQSVTITV